MSEFDSLLKRMLYAGIGAVASVGEKVQEKQETTIVDELQAEKKINILEEPEMNPDLKLDIQEEGKQMVKDFIKETEKRKLSLEEKLGLHISSLLNKMDLSTRSEFDELEERLSKLEKKAGIDLKISFSEEEE